MNHTLLFTGHMIDAPGRAVPRFPPRLEGAAAAAIRLFLEGLKAAPDGAGLEGIAGGACGGDILFHEACRSLGIPTGLYLALPAAAFAPISVAFAGQDWLARFERLRAVLPVQVLPDSRPGDDTVWDRANKWMLRAALARGGRLTLLALWNGAAGDGAGGTADMIRDAKQAGAGVAILTPEGLPAPQ